VVAWSFIDQSLGVELVDGLNAMDMMDGEATYSRRAAAAANQSTSATATASSS